MMNTRKKYLRGAASIDTLITAGFIAAVVLFVLSLSPKVIYEYHVAKFTADTSTISNAAERWKSLRPNFDGVTMSKLCTDNYLDASICGSTKDGKSTNPFGGDWTIAANTNKGLYDITGTLPNDTDHLNELADKMAPTTRAHCVDATSCATLKKSTNSITMTF
uniref:Uncharacterized protein n=1 Tax=Vibrio sp. 23023 TaxID=452803 RepID=A9M4S1_9VIBR|nr:hypothetical protein [Vibrio sp. 23023]ABX77003.1 Hypothetical protein BMSA_0053 [Vibrio sp. 23023]